MVRHWGRLPSKAMECPSVETFKTHLDTTLVQPALADLALSRGWTGRSPEEPSHLCHPAALSGPW